MSFQTIYNNALKIFSQLYVGIKPTYGTNPGSPLGFATPYEDNAAGRKRQETVKNWVGHYEYEWVDGKQIKKEYTPNLKIVDNVPLEGFKITDDVKRIYWGGGNVVWRVEDPRGWELEIQSNNLMALIQSLGIQAGGVINGKCIWAREGAQNILIAESSQEYRDAIKAAETVKKPKQLQLKDRVVGATYRLATGEAATYLGKVTVFKECRGTPERPHILIAEAVNLAREKQKLSVVSDTGSVYKTVSADQFEAVLMSENHWSRKKWVRLYKSASLVELIKDGTLTSVGVQNTLDTALCEYASSSAIGTPIAVFAEKLALDDVQYQFVQLDARAREVTEAIQNARHRYKPQNRKETSCVAEFFGTHGELLFKDATGKIYGFLRHIDSRWAWSPLPSELNAEFLSPIQINSDLEYTALYCAEYGRRPHVTNAGHAEVNTASFDTTDNFESALRDFTRLVENGQVGQIKLIKKS